jgi:hypothetical protein
MLEAEVQQRTLAARPHAVRGEHPDALAALKAGLIAAAVALALLQVFAIAIYDESPWKLMRMMAALVRGPGALEPDDEFDAVLIAVGMLLHFALSLLYALALACLVSEAPRRHVALIGLACGTALYYANFYGFTALFPWFAPHRTIDTLMVHMLFGVIAAEGYRAFAPGSAR